MTNEDIEQAALELAQDVMGDYREMLPRFEDAMRELVSRAYEEAAQVAEDRQTDCGLNIGAPEAIRTLAPSIKE